HEIVLRAHAVKIPVAVRYAWAQNPDCNLINSVGLPAVPFRTDDWPGVTVDCL
ncbi:MAG: sialate O-acetylesterase, partial [Planctomycetota bacterium]|nr:sialate O-acetylesterase [Planctomycetota bacterium]